MTGSVGTGSRTENASEQKLWRDAVPQAAIGTEAAAAPGNDAFVNWFYFQVFLLPATVTPGNIGVRKLK
jgi:hypothetical protein